VFSAEKMTNIDGKDLVDYIHDRNLAVAIL